MIIQRVKRQHWALPGWRIAVALALSWGLTACNADKPASSVSDPDPAIPTAVLLLPTPAPVTPAAKQRTGQAASFESADAAANENIDLYATSAPEFPADLEWLNTDRPLTLAQLRGKVVLLDFWTYGCINCLHNFPELKRLQAAYPNELVIIGIHSAKFTNESQTANIRQVILRYGLDYPVINDHALKLWHDWNAKAWPTTVLIDPTGNLAGLHVGEGAYDAFYALIRLLVQSAEARGKLDRTSLALKLEKAGLPETVLSFPGKVLAENGTNRLFIADTNHNRLVVANASSGEVLNVIGNGAQGFADGDAQTARFAQPQGLALDPVTNVLYVADAGNHAIRQINLTDGQVSTFAGTGKRLTDFPPQRGTAPAVALSSPWDLALDGDLLYIAMAGVHQLWTADLRTGEMQPWVGSAREGTQDGALTQAELAQPSGLVLDGAGRLYFADSEASSIRWATLKDGMVQTLVGAGHSLFDFGDVDGVGQQARLQHPLGVALADGLLYVVDTYNSKVKRIDPQTGESKRLVGSTPGWRDGSDPLFYEPGGISAANHKLYIADTNNHAIRVVDLATLETSTLVLKGIQRFAVKAEESYTGKRIQLAPITVAAGAGAIVLDLALPTGYKLNPLAPQSIEWRPANGIVDLPPDANRTLTAPTLPLTFDVTFHPGAGILLADLTVIYCEAVKESLCLIDQVRLEAPLTVTSGGPTEAHLTYTVPTPK